MGAYGFRGLIEKKELFIQSIPGAIQNLAWLQNNRKLNLILPELNGIFKFIIESEEINSITPPKKTLNINLSSFSFKRGIPYDASGHGGGFVFDCRCLPNPGRFDEFKLLTGRDSEVINFFLKPDVRNEIELFFSHCASLANQSVENYLHRKNDNLSISFGCTGGQHRSVYLSEKLKFHLEQQYKDQITVTIKHHELSKVAIK